MQVGKNITLGDIRRSHPRRKVIIEWRRDWAMTLFSRQPGFVVAWVALKLGISANMITLMSLVVTLALPVVAYGLPLPVAGIVVFAMAMTHQVFDCADGTVARVSGTASDHGGRFDFLVDMLHWGTLYASIGLLADQQFESFWMWTALGLLAGWLRLLARVFRDSVPTSKLDDPDAPPPPFVVMVFGGLSGLIPFLALLGGNLHLGIFALLIYSALDVGDAIYQVMR